MTQKRLYPMLPFFMLALVFSIFLQPSFASDIESTAPEKPAKILLELFTSQGCSSCPPADALLSALGNSKELKDRIVPLAFHVEYWNNLGWVDPFSHKHWSYRQLRYARVFGKEDYVYTPQMVIQGRTECLGSDAAKVRAHIRHASRKASSFQLKTHLVSMSKERLVFDVQVETSEKKLPSELWGLAAVFENGLTTDIQAGENNGRQLENNYVVRYLQKAFVWNPATENNRKQTITLGLDPAWNSHQLGVAVWLQDPVTMKIHGVQSFQLSSTLPSLDNS